MKIGILSRKAAWVLTLITLLVTVVAVPTTLAKEPPGRPTPVRFSTFNASFNRFNAGDLIADLSTPSNPQAKAVAEIVQRTRPHVLLINEFDYDEGGIAAHLFQDNYLSVPQSAAEPIHYPYRFVAPSNTGVMA